MYISAPQKTRPCDEKDKHYCLNNGTCNIMVELNEKFCTYVNINDMGRKPNKGSHNVMRTSDSRSVGASAQSYQVFAVRPSDCDTKCSEKAAHRLSWLSAVRGLHGPKCKKVYLMTFGPNEDADQPAQLDHNLRLVLWRATLRTHAYSNKVDSRYLEFQGTL